MRFSIFTILFLVGAFFSRAQEALPVPEPSTPVLSIPELVDQVLSRNPELEFYHSQLALAKADFRQSGIYENPELSASVGAKRATGNGFSAEGAAWSASVQQPFEFPGRMALRKAIANQDIRLAELGLEHFKALLAARARTFGYSFYTAQERAQAATEVANRLQELLDFLVQRDPAGVAPLLENRVIEASVVTFRKQAIEASQALQSALFEVNLLRGASLDAPLRIAPVELKFPSLPDRNELLTAARLNSFEIRMRLAELEQQGLKVDLSKSERWPDISVGPFVSQERAGERETVAGIGISLPLPLWNRNAGNIEAEKARQQQAETSLYMVRLKTERELLQEWLAYRLRVQEMQQWHTNSIQRFAQAAELGDRHYRLGSLPIATYIELQREYLEAFDSILSLQLEALTSLQELEVLTQTELGDAIQPARREE